MRTHVSFQNAGGTNISSINALFEVDLYVQVNNRGCGDAKRVYGIEMNQAREL